MDLYTNGTKAHKFGSKRNNVKPEEFNNKIKHLVELTNIDEGKLDTKSQERYPKRVKQIYNSVRLCTLDCGLMVEDQRVDLQLYRPGDTWLKHCRSCQKYIHPVTGEFTTLHLVNQYYREIERVKNK